MEMKKLIKPSAVALGWAGAAVAAPYLAPFLGTVSLPFFGAVLANVFKESDFQEGFGKLIVNAGVNVLANLSTSALQQLPDALRPEHNFHLEKMLATAYLESLEAVEKEIGAGKDAELKEQGATVFPLLKDRIKRGLEANEPFTLFPLQTEERPADTAFANRFSAEKISLLVADEGKWRQELGDEVEIALRRWLNEERVAGERATRQTQLGLAKDTPLPEHLRSHLRAELPHRIAHRISELVKRGDFKESWIAFQRAHLQGMLHVVERINASQADIKQSVNALTQRIKGFANQDEFVTAIAGKLQEFLSQTSLPQDRLDQLLERQSEELRGLEERLVRTMHENKEEVIGKIRGATDEIKEEFQKAILQGAIRAAQIRLKQLPAPPRDFTGRETELKELRQAVQDGGVTISGVQGMGGLGKTALALKLAHEFKDHYPDGQIYLDLKGVSQQPLSHAEIMWHVVSSFQPELKRPDDDQLPSYYNSLLNEHRVLLFYDNAQDAAQIEPLLPPEHCLLLVASRRHFSLPGMFDKDLDELPPADAEKLLLKIAPRIAAEAAAVAKQCGYLPVALRLAASALHQSRTLSPSDLVRRLQDKQRRVALVEASFSLSYELLSEELQRRWRMLAIFPGDFAAPAAAAVWQTEVDQAKDALAELEEYSLLEWEETAKRYSLHDLARDFADTRLHATEREQAGSLHAAHYLQILSTADDLYLKGSEAVAEGLSLLDNERVNIEAGQEWVAARFAGDDQAAQLCNEYPNAGVYILDLRQHPRDSIRWQESALHAARKLRDRQSEGARLGSLGGAYRNLGEDRTAIDYYEQALTISREVGDRDGEGSWLGNLGISYKNLGEVRTAIDYSEQALAISREIGDRRGEGSWLGSLGTAYRWLGEVRTAIDYYEQALAISRETGDQRNEGIWLGSLGTAYKDLGEGRTAIDYYEQALAISREVGDRRGEGVNLGNLGVAYKDLGEVRTAIDYYEQALAISREIGDRRGEGNRLGNLGGAYHSLGEVRTAIDYSEQALAISREIGDRRGEGVDLGNLGVAYKDLGETEKAVGFMEAALKIFEEVESPNANTVRRWLEELHGENE